MENTSGFVVMLRESLERKIFLLDRIIAVNEKQLDVLRDVNSLPEDLEATVNEKSDLVEELDTLDEGFETVFSKVKIEIEKNRDIYRDEISKMKILIRQITDRSAQIQSQEIRNKENAEGKFSYIKDQVKKITMSQKAVNTYYRNMMKVNYVDPQFMDDKK